MEGLRTIGFLFGIMIAAPIYGVGWACGFIASIFINGYKAGRA